jgi:hypothetical protein
MIRIYLAVALTVTLSGPAAAQCPVAPELDDGRYPRGQQALLLCQQRALSETVDDRVLAAQIRALQAQIQALRLEQQRLELRPIETWQPPRF